MRRMSSKLRMGGLAAVVGATTLVFPLLAIGPAQAAPAADLSIEKTVASVAPPITFDPALRDVRATGHEDWTRDGLHIWTEDWNSTDKVGEYVATSKPLATIGEPSLAYTTILGTIPPGFVLKVDVTGDGVSDGELIGESTFYGNDWWLNEPLGNPGDFGAFVAGAPVVGGGSGSTWHGTLDQWRTAFPTATVTAFGFGLGSGVFGEGYVTALDFAGTHYDLTRDYESSIQAAPGDTVEYKIAIANNGDAGASNITISDLLPSDLTYVPGSLSRPDWCSVTGRTLSCTGGVLPPGTSSNVYLQATISDTVSSAGLPATAGHIVDVQKQEVFADLPAGATKTYSVLCPTGYVPTDGGLLLDAVDQGGDYADIVVAKSKPTVQSGIKGWTVTASNLGEQRGQGKVKVTCLDETIGSSNGHTHTIDLTDSTAQGTISASSPDTNGELVTVSCSTGYTPIAPEHTVTSGIAVIRSSYADANVWRWVVDHEVGTAATFDVDCLAPETASSNGHTATLPLTTQQDTISVGPESRDEGIEQCGSSANAITGGYAGQDASVLSLGKEQRGNNYMFRFYNEDWSQAWNADIQVTCVGVRTADEPQYYHITNTATVSSPDDPTNSSSSADIAIVGDAVQPAAGVLVGPNGNRSGDPGSIKKVGLRFTCTSACAFTVKVIKGGNVVAKATKSLAASPNVRWVYVPTTSAGKNLAHNDVVTVRVRTSTATTNTSVTLD
ncbi:conserved repeat domain [Nocardioides sp. JS614]|nr:conserved repeat domain [Nocardioides sp. JS614]